MGTSAAVGRRTLVKVAEDCIAAVNDCNVRVTTLETTHNAFVDEMGTRVDLLKDRVGVHAAWHEKHEKAAAELDVKVKALFDGVFRVQAAAHRLTVSAPPVAGFFPRLRWLLFGRAPDVPK